MDRLRLTGNYIEDMNNGLVPISPPPPPSLPAGGISALLRTSGGQPRYNIPNADVGDGNQGYVVDLNGNGQYNRGQDAIVGLDFDGDGNLSHNEMARSRAMFGNWGESQYDRNHDGRISNEELNEAGGRAWVDKNRDGKIGADEVSTVNDFRTNNGAQPQERHRINEIDPSRRRSDVTTDRLQSWEDDNPATKRSPPLTLPPTQPTPPWGEPKRYCPGINDPILDPNNRKNNPWGMDHEQIRDMMKRVTDGPMPPSMRYPRDPKFKEAFEKPWGPDAPASGRRS